MQFHATWPNDDIDLQGTTLRDDHRTFDDVLQFSHVAWPTIAGKQFKIGLSKGLVRNS